MKKINLLLILSIFFFTPFVGANASSYYNTSYFGFDYDDYNYNNNHHPNPYYDFKWTKTGGDIDGYDSYKFKIDNQVSDFRSNQDVYVLTYLANIKNINKFNIKYDVYRDGSKYYKRNVVPTAYPRGNEWEYNYSWGNLGKLPVGNHEIRVYIKVNGEQYRYLTSKQIRVGSYTNNYYHNKPIDVSHYISSRNKPFYGYRHSWAKADTRVNFLGRYMYDTPKDRSIFYDDEDVKILSKIDNIKNVDYFRIKHKLYKDTTYKTQKISDIRRPNGDYWEYNYYDSNFGQLRDGSYTVKIYISIEGGDYMYVAKKDFKVTNRDDYYKRDDWQTKVYYRDDYRRNTYNPPPSYTYGGTRVSGDYVRIYYSNYTPEYSLTNSYYSYYR